MDAAAKRNNAAKAAIESALFDAVGRTLGVPAVQLLGGVVRERMPVFWTLASGDPAQEIEEAEAKLAARLHDRFKIKIGAQPLADDLARLRRLIASVRGAEAFREGKATTVSGFIALDPSTVRVVLDEAQAPLVSMLAIGYAKIVPRDRVIGRSGCLRAGARRHRPIQVRALGAGQGDRPGRQPRLLRRRPPPGPFVYRVFPGEQFGAMFNEFRRGSWRTARCRRTTTAQLLAPPPRRTLRQAADVQRPLHSASTRA